MKTKEKLPDELGGELVEVEWELGDRFDDAGDGHVFMHQSEGIDDNGHMFFGEGIVCDGEWTEVENVEYAGLEKDIKNFKSKLPIS
jgi:hypothetical protein